MSDPAPVVDHTQIRYPSDQWTIGELRKLWPKSFDKIVEHPYPGCPHDINRDTPLDDTIGDLIDSERLYADMVFRQALGLPDRFGKPADPDVAAELLIDYYTHPGGLRLGQHEGRELARSIKDQALAQADRHLSPSRG